MIIIIFSFCLISSLFWMEQFCCVVGAFCALQGLLHGIEDSSLGLLGCDGRVALW
jgi:hypothetical protein